MRRSLYEYRIHVYEYKSPSEELLGIKIDINLTFHNRITSSCSKANKRLEILYFLTI